MKLGTVKWTDEVFALGITIWELPFQIDINLGWWRFTIGGS
jgi:hypothetical protein|tara:strand:+ start:336 stop:458 length:123 start_codon:yes stop_codon:yes gene_type:complete